MQEGDVMPCGCTHACLRKFRTYKNVSKNNVTNTLMPRTLFQLQCVCGTLVAGATHPMSL